MFSKKIVLIITFTLGILLTFVAIFNRISPKNPPTPIIVPTITVASSPAPGIRKTSNLPPSPSGLISQTDTLPQNVLTALLSELPYETDTFLAEYYPHDRVIMVTMKRAGENSIEKAVRWLIAQGVTNPEQNKRVIFSYWKGE